MIQPKQADAFSSDKIILFSQAQKLVSALKAKGQKIGLCHGGFDMLHPGHIKHFESAKKLCDILLVSVTSDRFVTKRKGPGRPVFGERLRAYAIANLSSVDHVVISDYERATEVISGLGPTFYIKGPDYVNKATPGIAAERDAVARCGGEILYTDDEKLSTTEIIQSIKSRSILVGVDRDGTLIRHVPYLGKEDDWKDHIIINEDVIKLLGSIKTSFDPIFIVISNQSGVARGYFDCKRVEEINAHVHALLKEREIEISSWQYCPDIDTSYADRSPENHSTNFVKAITRRKPSPQMVYDALASIEKSIEDFDSRLVIGDHADDEKLGENIHADFINVSGKDYNQMKEMLDRMSS